MKKWIIRLAILGVVGYGLLELMLWTLFPVGIVQPFSLRLENELPGFSASSRVTLDSDGVRSFGYRAAGKKVLCLGGDNTIAVLQGTADTWWGIAARAVGGDVGIAAWGVPGGISLTNYRFLLGNIGSLKPDLVVMVVPTLDRIAMVGLTKSDEMLLGEPLVIGASGWKRSVLELSQTARRLRNILKRDDGGYLRELQGANTIADRIAIQHQVYEGAALSLNIVGGGDPDSAMETVIRKTRELCDEHGARLLVVSEPIPQEAVMTGSEQDGYVNFQVVKDEKGRAVPVRIDPGALKTEFERFFDRLAAICEADAVNFVPLHRELAPAGALYFGDRYLNDRGHRALAEVLAPHLEKNLD